MQFCNPLRGAAAPPVSQHRLLPSRPQSFATLPYSTRAILQLEEVRHRLQSIGTTLCSTNAVFSHLEEFTYRPRPSPFKGPSLRRGWILSRDHDVPQGGLELLLSEEQHQEADIPERDQWRKRIEGDESQRLFEGNGFSVEIVSSGRRSADLVQEDEKTDEDDMMTLQQLVEGNGVTVEGGNGQLCDRLSQENQNKDEEDSTLQTKPKYVRGPDIDKKSFMRVYYISALRVPAAECWDLVFELREHLLNWPRVKNIGRVPGDDVDQDLAIVFDKTPERKQRIIQDEVRAAVYSVSETELAGESKLGIETTKEEIVRSREAPTMLDLVEAAERESDLEDITPTAVVLHLNLLKKWEGPTRLLLLDEKYAGKSVSELPEALQVFNEDFQTFLSKIFDIKRPLPITQVVMSHPSGRAKFLEFFRGVFSQRTWPNVSLPRIHLYSISKDSDPEESVSKEIAAVLRTRNFEISTHLVTEMALGEWMVSASFILPPHFGFK